MSVSQTMPVPLAMEPVDGDKPTVHAVCRGCYPMPGPDDVGMCGEQLARPAIHDVPPPDRPFCVICAELHEKPCERCGA